MTATLTAVDNILKEVYEDRIRDQLQSEITTLKRIESTTEGVTEDAVGGKYTTFPVRIKRNHGMGARAEMQALPTPKVQGWRSARVNLKYLYGSILLTGQTMKLATTKRQSFASALEEEIKGMREGLKKDTNRQVYGTNRGNLSTANAGGTTTTFVTDTDGVQYLEEGMVVDIYDSTDTDAANVLNDSEIEIDTIEETSSGVWTITFGETVTATASGDFLTRHGSRGVEKTGFEQIVMGQNTSVGAGDGDGTGELYNITHNIWTGNVEDISGALTEGDMIAMVKKIKKRGGDTTVVFTTQGVHTAYFNLLSAQRRFPNTKEFAGGFTGLAFHVGDKEIPVIEDLDCQPGRMYFMNEGEIKLYQEGDWGFLDKDGSMWERHRDSNGRYDAWLADFYKYCEMGTHRRNSHGVLTNVTEVS